MPLAPGTRLGNYEVLAPLGAGGMGEVYRARDTRLGREVAIKVLPSDMALDADRLARFEREARTVAGLNHPNIVVLHSVEDAGGIRFLTMELVEGQTLLHQVVPGGLPAARVVDLGLALADALTAAHEKGVVHRDLKPGNVMLTSEGRLKVLDFGLARVTAPDSDHGLDLTQPATMAAALSGAGQVAGTLPYMAPEQLRGEAVDARSDLFSLGVLLYELASGRRPFQGADSASLISSILRDDPQPVPNADLWRVLGRSLAKAPLDRFQSARELRAALSGVSREAAAPAAPAAPAAGPSVAVLPFRNMSADPENEYFSDGITEELLNSLAQLKGLKVAARTSSFAFKNQAADLGTIASKLGVGTVLEGSVRRQGQRVRITAQLVNAADGYQLWSEAFDRELDDVFAIQADIAERVALALRVTLLASDAERLRSRDTAHPAAYDAYLHGLAQMAAYSVEAALEASRSFERAAELDPQFAKAFAGIANANIFAYEISDFTREQMLRVAEPAMERALALDPSLSEAHAARGGVLAARRDYAGAKAAFRRALELNPGNALASHFYGMMLWALWELDEVVDVFNHALRIDPLDAALQGFRGMVKQTMNRLDEAEADFARARSVGPANPAGFYMGGGFFLDARGDAAEAAKLMRRAAEVDPTDPEIFAWVGHCLYSLGDYAGGAEAARHAVELGPRNGVAWASHALAHVYLDRVQDAIDLARRGSAPRITQRWASRLLLFRILRIGWLRDGLVGEAIQAYEAGYPSVARGESLFTAPLELPQYGGFGEVTGAALDLAHLRRASGDEAGALTLIRLVRTTLEREPRMGFVRLFGSGLAEAQLAMLEGRPAEALAALARAVDAGFIANWRFSLERDPIWDAVRAEAEFVRLVARLEGRAREQRARLAAR